jgi:hypothetical protein
LHAGAEAAGLVATELRKAAEILLAQPDQGAAIEERIVEKYLQLPPELQRIVVAKIEQMIEDRP